MSWWLWALGGGALWWWERSRVPAPSEATQAALLQQNYHLAAAAGSPTPGRDTLSFWAKLVGSPAVGAAVSTGVKKILDAVLRSGSEPAAQSFVSNYVTGGEASVVQAATGQPGPAPAVPLPANPSPLDLSTLSPDQFATMPPLDQLTQPTTIPATTGSAGAPSLPSLSIPGSSLLDTGGAGAVATTVPSSTSTTGVDMAAWAGKSALPPDAEIVSNLETGPVPPVPLPSDPSTITPGIQVALPPTPTPDGLSAAVTQAPGATVVTLTQDQTAAGSEAIQAIKDGSLPNPGIPAEHLDAASTLADSGGAGMTTGDLLTGASVLASAASLAFALGSDQPAANKAIAAASSAVSIAGTAATFGVSSIASGIAVGSEMGLGAAGAAGATATGVATAAGTTGSVLTTIAAVAPYVGIALAFAGVILTAIEGMGETTKQKHAEETAMFVANIAAIAQHLGQALTPLQLLTFLQGLEPADKGGLHTTITIGGVDHPITDATVTDLMANATTLHIATRFGLGPYAQFEAQMNQVAQDLLHLFAGVLSGDPGAIETYAQVYAHQVLTDPLTQTIPLAPLRTFVLPPDIVAAFPFAASRIEDEIRRPYLDMLARWMGYDHWEAWLADAFATPWRQFEAAHPGGTVDQFAQTLGSPTFRALRDAIYAGTDQTGVTTVQNVNLALILQSYAALADRVTKLETLEGQDAATISAIATGLARSGSPAGNISPDAQAIYNAGLMIGSGG